MSWSRPVDPALATRNPAGYRARVALMDAQELLKHLRSLSQEQMCQHLRAVLTPGALKRRGEVGVGIEFWGGSLEASIRFGKHGANGNVHYRDGFPPTVHAAVLSGARELAREERMALPEFTIRFARGRGFEPFSLAPIEGFLDSSRALVASELVPRRFVLMRYPEQQERGTVDPAYVTLFAHLTTDRGEAVGVELCSTTHPGYEERLVGWATQRAAEAGVPLEQHRP